MDDLSKHRLTANEALFRAFNEQVQQSIDATKALAKEENQEALLPDLDEPLQFYCECSNAKCTKRVPLKPSTYEKIHKIRNHFTIVPGHEIEAIEKIIRKDKIFYVVEKLTNTPGTT